jgi:hypothetical protein
LPLVRELDESLDFGKLIEQQSADGVASDARRGGKRASWVGAGRRQT